MESLNFFAPKNHVIVNKILVVESLRDRGKDLAFDYAVNSKNLFGFFELRPLGRMEKFLHKDTQHYFSNLILEDGWVGHRSGYKLFEVMINPPVEVVVNVLVMVYKNKQLLFGIQTIFVFFTFLLALHCSGLVLTEQGLDLVEYRSKDVRTLVCRDRF